MRKRRLLDSFALVSYLNKEAGFEKVVELMSEADRTGKKIFMNEINIGEVYYILHRRRGYEKADFFLERVLPSLPLQAVPNEFEDVIAAAKIKAEYVLSFADCFAVATAMKEDLIVVTGDPEFKIVEHLMAIDWL